MLFSDGNIANLFGRVEGEVKVIFLSEFSGMCSLITYLLHVK